MSKRGQVTVFIILGIIIIALVVGFLLVRSNLATTDIATEPGLSRTGIVKSFVESCLSSTGEQGIYFIGQQGGYYDVPQEISLDYFSFTTPIYLSPDYQQIPDLNTIEGELSQYIEANLAECINDFVVFEDYQIESEEFSVRTNIINKRINFNLHYPLQIKQSIYITEFKDFTTTLKLDFRNFFSQIEDSLEIIKQSPEAIPLGELINLAHEDNYQLETDNLDGETVLYVYLFDPGAQEKEPFVFNYAVKYDWPEELFALS